MNKRFIISLTVSICSVWAMAQSSDGLVIDKVSMAAGSTKEVTVSLNDSKGFTALQFDLKLPEGVTIAKDGDNLKASSLQADHEFYVADMGSNTYRFLMFSMENSQFSKPENGVFKMTLATDKDLESGASLLATAEGELLVTPACEETNVDDGDLASIEISTGDYNIKITKAGKATLVSADDLDFTNVEGLKAYIATGYDIDDKKIWLTRVSEVPAGTPLYLIGDQGEYTVPVGCSKVYYPENFLKGSATEDVAIDNTDGYDNFTLGSAGFKPAGTTTTNGKGKSYFHAPSSVASDVSGSSIKVTIGNAGKATLVSQYDLDFSGFENLKAYTATGFKSSTGVIWLTRVNKVSKGTPIYLMGDKGEYDVPSLATQSAYVNMFAGSATDDIALDSEMNGSTIFVLKSAGFSPATGSSTNKAGKAYLPIPTSYVSGASSRTRSRLMDDEEAITFVETEVIGISLASLTGEDEGITTIRSIDVNYENDVYYNLQGQRVEKPGKGLYIKNGKKVLIK